MTGEIVKTQTVKSRVKKALPNFTVGGRDGTPTVRVAKYKNKRYDDRGIHIDPTPFILNQKTRKYDTKPNHTWDSNMVDDMVIVEPNAQRKEDGIPSDTEISKLIAVLNDDDYYAELVHMKYDERGQIKEQSYIVVMPRLKQVTLECGHTHEVHKKMKDTVQVLGTETMECHICNPTTDEHGRKTYIQKTMTNIKAYSNSELLEMSSKVVEKNNENRRRNEVFSKVNDVLRSANRNTRSDTYKRAIAILEENELSDTIKLKYNYGGGHFTPYDIEIGEFVVSLKYDYKYPVPVNTVNEDGSTTHTNEWKEKKGLTMEIPIEYFDRVVEFPGWSGYY